MSILWLQLLLNIIFCYWVYTSLKTKIQLGRMEERLYNLDLYLRELSLAREARESRSVVATKEASSSQKEPAQQEASVRGETSARFLAPLTAGPASTLSEHQIGTSRMDQLDVYAEAAQSLARGESAKMVASKTGLSLSELRLVQKLTSISS